MLHHISIRVSDIVSLCTLYDINIEMLGFVLGFLRLKCSEIRLEIGHMELLN